MFNKYLVLGTLAMGSLFVATMPEAMLQAPKLFGEEYKSVPPVVNQLTQIVYYRAKQPSHDHPAANVYVDGRYHTSLMPGGFTRFCLKPGEHALGAFVNDPQYRGKTEGRFVADLQGGRTYFLRVDEEQRLDQPPVAVSAGNGESEVRQTHRQIHTRSRATSVESCVYDRAAAQRPSTYLYSARQLFKQDNGFQMLSDEGQEAVNDMVITLRQQHPMLHSVSIRIHSAAGLATQRNQAKAIRTALMLAAIPDKVISTDFSDCRGQCSAGNQDIQVLVR